ncbi:MAG: N-acetylmuramic acid 6-phosphate etherase [Rhodospirillales bacterium]|nr:N-acetylmuramic acid 6-phosphate etherase [Rhodospirillales bacterium]MCB9995474.1 N-acetylmuramic acid 6-phosphate etherase [Rhodospirillales bacterium]
MTKKTDDRITEQFNDRFRGMDEWPVDQVLSRILEDQIRAVQAVRAAVPQIDAAVREAARRLQGTDGRLIYIGAGTPARLGVQDGTELTPTFGWPKERMAFVIAGGQKALFEAVEGAEDDVAAARRDIAALNVGEHDVCIAVSASGTTPYTVEACRVAREAGAASIGIASNAKAPLYTVSDFPVYLDSGVEPVGGSTRMNAGTVQKIALNMISTAVMVKLGHVFDGMMVDVKLNNVKLRQRAERMVSKITGCDEEQAAKALDASGQGVNANVKLAVLIVKGYSPEAGRKLLDETSGNLRTALNRPDPLMHPG